MPDPCALTDCVVDDMARAMWDADLESQGIATLPTAWERSKPLYRRRARAGLEVLIEHGVLAGELP